MLKKLVAVLSVVAFGLLTTGDQVASSDLVVGVPTPTFSIQMDAEGVKLIDVDAQGRVYTLEASGDLQSWAPVWTGTQSTLCLKDWTEGHCFFRVKVQ